jgi:hypothetical protein
LTAPLANSAPERPIDGWRQSRWLVLVDFLLVALIFVADFKHIVPLSKTPFLVLLGWISLRLRGLRWRDAGLTRKHSWPTILALGVAAGILLEAIELFMSQPLLVRLTGKQPDLSDFTNLHGNAVHLLIGVALAWTLAAFGEEMAWRGYLMNRFADLGNGARIAWILGLVIVNIAFGFAHSYQGITGIIDEGFMGLLLGLLFLSTGRNLLVPIVAHGVSDTIDLVLMYLGKYPGT